MASVVNCGHLQYDETNELRQKALKGETMFTREFLEQINEGFEAQMQRIGTKREQVEAVMAQSTEAEAEAIRCSRSAIAVR